MANNILNFSINIFPEDSPKLESFPNCGRVGNPNNTECILDCEWVNNPKLNQPVHTGVIQLDALFPPGYRYNLIKYPETLSCIEDCRILYRMRQITSWPEIRQLVEDVTRWNPNLDNIIFEVCALYFELNGSTGCFNRPIFLTRQGNLSKNKRLLGNSLISDERSGYDNSTIEYTLNQYPWVCSICTAGYRGHHICGATLLSAPPSKTILVTAVHCNYICQSSEGTPRETCCCRDPDENFASCRKVREIFL